MALLFMDGFDHYATSDISKKWSAAGGSTTIEAGSGRRGGGCMRSTSTSPSATKNFGATNSFVAGFAFRTNGLTSGPWTIAALLDSGTVQCSLVINTDGSLSVVRGTATAVTAGTSAPVITIDTYYFIEWKITISDAIPAGSCEVRVNGAAVLTVAAGQDLKATANATANQFRLSQAGTLSTRVQDFDDFYLCDQAGSSNNDFLGDVRIDTIYPNASGTHQAWTTSTGTDHASLVDEATPNTTDYLTGSAAGSKETLGLQDLSINGAILGVQVNNAVSKTDAGACTIKNLIRSGSTESSGPTYAPSTSYLYSSSIHEADPATGAAWLTAAINALEAGAEVVS